MYCTLLSNGMIQSAPLPVAIESVLHRQPLVLYHADCMDGFTAAWAVWRAVPEAEFVAVYHGDDPPDCTDRDVIIVDFSYKLPVMERLGEQCNSLILLDHHLTAVNELMPWQPPCPHQIELNVTKSGAMLAWEHFHAGVEPPALVRYVQARDLWTFHLPFSHEVNAVIASCSMKFDVWDQLEKAISNDPTHLRSVRD